MVHRHVIAGFGVCLEMLAEMRTAHGPSRTVVWVQDQYPAHQIQAHVPQHGPRYEHKNVPFEGTTTNQDAYKAYAVEPHRAMHAPVVARPYTKFEGTCTCTVAPA